MKTNEMMHVAVAQVPHSVHTPLNPDARQGDRCGGWAVARLLDGRRPVVLVGECQRCMAPVDLMA